jgi:hypothetical protein
MVIRVTKYSSDWRTNKKFYREVIEQKANCIKGICVKGTGDSYNDFLNIYLSGGCIEIKGTDFHDMMIAILEQSNKTLRDLFKKRIDVVEKVENNENHTEEFYFEAEKESIEYRAKSNDEIINTIIERNKDSEWSYNI